MIIGERFNVTGYDLLASAHVARGGGPPDREEAIVLGNNSSHFFVAFRERESKEATLVMAYRYAGNDTNPDDEDEITAQMYAMALDRMCRFAKEN